MSGIIGTHKRNRFTQEYHSHSLPGIGHPWAVGRPHRRGLWPRRVSQEYHSHSLPGICHPWVVCRLLRSVRRVAGQPEGKPTWRSPPHTGVLMVRRHHPLFRATQNLVVVECTKTPSPFLPHRTVGGAGMGYNSHPGVGWTQSQPIWESVKEPTCPVGWTQPQSAGVRIW